MVEKRLRMTDLVENLPKLPGVYLFKDKRDKIIYVGKARSLRDRVSSYFVAKSLLLPKTQDLVKKISHIDHIVTESEIDALILEANLIRRYAPKYNVNWKDGKYYPLIEITIKDKVPQVKKVHQEKNKSKRALYFGPYPTGSDLYGLLRYLRKIFPFVSQNHTGKNLTCLRSHLGLCPCPDVYKDDAAKDRYRRNLKNLIDFLAGKRQTIQKRLIREMQAYAKNQKYEEASQIKKKLAQLELLTIPRREPWEYETNPNLVADIRQSEQDDLKKTLGLSKLSKIECYDISNLSGKNATGGQVVFVNGVPEKSLYRRYKIKFKTTPDDFAMIKEMLSRRLKSELPLPDLIVIDGGKGQLSAAMAVILNKRGVSKNPHREVSPTPKIITLAKHLETIYTDDGREIRLPDDSPALHLLQKVRDEAHRFSRRYHFWLRAKNMLG